MNRGDGKLERVPYDNAVSVWRRSFQSVWSDIDNDGDDDLYVSNDFAPDTLLRNDTEQPVLTEVSTETGLDKQLGFGMGVSYGDFDKDGDLDLYVSNMFSKACRRIANKAGKVDPRIKVAAQGSFLFENNEGKFEQKAGSGDDEYNVHQIGWSFGGQFADFDNDSHLDLYVPSGYYTAPKPIATAVDN